MDGDLDRCMYVVVDTNNQTRESERERSIDRFGLDRLTLVPPHTKVCNDAISDHHRDQDNLTLPIASTREIGIDQGLLAGCGGVGGWIREHDAFELVVGQTLKSPTNIRQVLLTIATRCISDGDEPLQPSCEAVKQCVRARECEI